MPRARTPASRVMANDLVEHVVEASALLLDLHLHLVDAGPHLVVGEGLDLGLEPTNLRDPRSQAAQIALILRPEDELHCCVEHVFPSRGRPPRL